MKGARAIGVSVAATVLVGCGSEGAQVTLSTVPTPPAWTCRRFP